MKMMCLRCERPFAAAVTVTLNCCLNSAPVLSCAWTAIECVPSEIELTYRSRLAELDIFPFATPSIKSVMLLTGLESVAAATTWKG